MKRRILIIEDNPGDVLLFRLALSEAGIDFELSELTDGGAAMAFASGREPVVPDLVVLDLNLPKASGREILTALRAAPALHSVPVVIWTSSNARSDREDLEQIGVARYLLKPPDLRDVRALGVTIREILNQAPQA